MTTKLNLKFDLKGHVWPVATVSDGAASPESGLDTTDVSVAHHSSRSLWCVFPLCSSKAAVLLHVVSGLPASKSLRACVVFKFLDPLPDLDCQISAVVPGICTLNSSPPPPGDSDLL